MGESDEVFSNSRVDLCILQVSNPFFFFIINSDSLQLSRCFLRDAPALPPKEQRGRYETPEKRCTDATRVGLTFSSVAGGRVHKQDGGKQTHTDCSELPLSDIRQEPSSGSARPGLELPFPRLCAPRVCQRLFERFCNEWNFPFRWDTKSLGIATVGGVYIMNLPANTMDLTRSDLRAAFWD